MDYIHSIEDLDAFVNEEMLSIVYVSRPGCSVCHGLLPQVEDLLADYPKIKARHVNADEVPQVAGHYSVMTVPAVLVYSEGKELFRKARFVPIGELNQQLAKLNHFINES
ncbi:thioredoxin [Halobacillus litoralis]|uniref:Thioredoxin n=1 Tax=Halobacillus litoralis TaxID=45668 RepID=A0A845DWZ8_9BACI|nr:MULTISPECIES: thioredoxin family protein [Halobacillus]MCA1022278.1 thioredoxin family protein [Halobacillus litoralis]MYL21349.1 thioredoxin [Halobacillus litoralis]MYL30208.1 thioredoxin [Halobacillus halophilus]MYL38199.1 thioredoxin [Halobacillus litoralis]